jgi:pilus assembly protein FimV
MSKKLIVLLALASAALPVAANALGLGEIKLNSALNDKFNADIPVVGATSDELDSLDVKLAGLNQFTQAGLDRPSVLDQLLFVVVRNPDGTSYIHITSNAAVREPFLDFLVDANWNNGELIREYTVLLNPPTFQTANAAPSTPAPQPAAAAPAATAPAAAVAATPVPVPVPVPTPVTQAAAPVAQPPAEVAAAPQAPAAVAPQAAPAAEATPAPTASPPPAPAPSVEQAPAQRALGTNYGPIRRGETLSSIAKSVRPDGITLNQMMIAIYQANPEVFMHNINRMKSGYILRMPTASDAQAVSVTDANSEVREQMQAWRSGTTATEATPSAATSASAAPALQLVAPGSAAESNAQVPGAATQAAAATAPEVTAAAAKTQPKSTGKGENPPPLPPPATQSPLAVNNNSLSAVQQQAAQQNAAPALPVPSAATNVPLAKPKAAPKSFTQPESGGGIMDMLPYILGGLIVIALIVLALVVIKKRKTSGASGASKGSSRIKADWMKQESVDSGDNTAASSTTRTKGKFKKSAAAEEAQDRTVLSEPPTELAGGSDSDKTMLMAAPPPAPMQETVVSGGSQLDVSDPMAEADFHMAYGLYDQAADVLRKALRQDPNSRPAQIKLLEVYFTAGDRNNFVLEAKKLRQAMGAAPDKDWESVAIMGRQVAPDESLFSSTGASAGSAVDISLDGGGTDTVVSDLDALEGAFASAGATPAPEAPAPAPAPVEDNSLEFSLPDLEPMGSLDAAPAEMSMDAPAVPATGTDFDLGDLNFEPTPSAAKPAEEKKTAPTLGTDEPTVATDFGTDSQVEFDKALNDLASFVNTNVPAQPDISPEQESEDKTMAIRPPKPPAELSMDAPAAEDTGGGSSMNEIGTKLDLARAYIDMGDPDGAKSILEEVVAEGNAQQKSEAQELLKHVS